MIEAEWTATTGLVEGRNLVLIRDVTTKNRTARDASFQAEVLDHVEAAVVAIDPRGRITHWNKASARLYGWTRDEAIGRWVRDLVVPVEAESIADEVWATVQEGESWEGETLVRRRDGEPLAVWNLNAPILDAAGVVAGYVGIAVDISEQRAQRALLAARAAQQAAVAELGQRVLAASDLPTALQDMVATVAHVLEVDIVTLLERAADDVLYVRVATGLDPESGRRGRASPSPRDAPAYRALESGEPSIAEDIAGSPDQPEETLGVKSIADVPVYDTQGGPWGVLSALADRQRHFTPDDLHFLQSVANVVAGAIHRTRRRPDPPRGAARPAHRAAEPRAVHRGARAAARRARAGRGACCSSTSTASSWSTTRSATRPATSCCVAVADRARGAHASRRHCSRASAATSSWCCCRDVARRGPRRGRRRARGRGVHRAVPARRARAST